MSTHDDFYERVETYERPMRRHDLFIERYRRHRERLGRPVHVLDIGCGEHAVLSAGVTAPDLYYGSDVKSSISARLERYVALDLDRDSLSEAWENRRFDVIFCSEVIEHVFSPDRLLRQIASVAADDCLAIISTPNLAYWVNRLMLLVGVNPMFVENSSEVVLGRRSRRLGQGNPTQGHIRLFTNAAMRDLLAREGYRLDELRSLPVWPIPGERLLSRLAPALGANTIYVTRPPTGGRV